MATLLNVRDRCYQRADRVNETTRYPNSEVNQYINDSYAELWAILMRHSLLPIEATTTITANGSTSYALPADYFGVKYVFRNEEYPVRLKSHQGYLKPFGISFPDTGAAYSYRTVKRSISGVLSDHIEFVPTPTSDTYTVVYFPTPALLSADSDELIGILGWDEYIVNDVAIKMLARENTEWGHLDVLKNRIMERIERESAMQDSGSPGRIAVVDRRHFIDPADIWWSSRGD